MAGVHAVSYKHGTFSPIANKATCDMLFHKYAYDYKRGSFAAACVKVKSTISYSGSPYFERNFAIALELKIGS